MAKLSARGCYEVGKVAAIKTVDGETYRTLFALRSDGQVLRRLAGEFSTGYSIFAKLAKPAEGNTFSRKDVERLRTWLIRRGYTVEDAR